MNDPAKFNPHFPVAAKWQATAKYSPSSGLTMCAALLFLLPALAASAQSSSRFTVTRQVTGSGGAVTTSGRFQLASFGGQSAKSASSSQRFSINSGTWAWRSAVIFKPKKVASEFIFEFESAPGTTYVVEFSDSTASPFWQNLSRISGDGNVKIVTNSAPDASQRYYRLREL